MKKALVIKAERTMEKVRALTRHIRNVEDNALLLGERLIMNGEIDLGHHLIANGFGHDLSKFSGIEWDELIIGPPTEKEENKLKLKMAVYQHQSVNKHHPEAWPNGIKEMPDVFLLEMICDWKSRSEEFGTSLKDWINEAAVKKWGFSNDDEIYKKIMKYVDILCETPFQNLEK